MKAKKTEAVEQASPTWFQRVVALEILSHAAASEEPIAVPRSRRKLYIGVGAVSALGVVAIGWAVCSVYLSQVLVSGVTIPAHASNKVLNDTISRRTAAYQLTIQYPDGKQKHYSFQKLGLTLDQTASVAATRQRQHRLAARVQWWQPVPAAVMVKTNKTALNNFIAAKANVTVQPSQDAVLAIVKGEIKITDAVVGKQYGLAQPQKTILAAASDLKQDTIRLQTLTVKPALTAKALEAYKPTLEKTLSQSISLTIGDKTVTPSPADIANWLEITPDDKSKKIDITVNSGKVLEYINAAAAADIHPPRAQIQTQQPDGSTKVLITGANGVDVPSKSSTATTISQTLLSGTGIDLRLPVNYEPFQTISTGSYNKWIEVDLTNKRMYAYEKDNLIKTELVTAGAPATPTVTGQYAIYSKFDQQDMRGSNVDGSNYFQPHVRWINYFYKDYAIHGNYWRPLSYFGNINSSHGCVSLVDVEAAWMYSWAPIGTPVIVHT